MKMFQLIADAVATTEKVATNVQNATNSTSGGTSQSNGGAMPFFANPMILMIVVFVIMIFFMSRSQKKQQREREAKINALTKGAKVLLASGIYGEIVEVQGDVFVVKIAEGVNIRVAKGGIADFCGGDK